MIDITKAQAGQSTVNGTKAVWRVTLDEEEIYTLPEHFTVQEVFAVRDIIEKMMKRAVDEVREQEQQLSLVKLNRVAESGNAMLAELRDENERLATALEQHIINGES